MSVKFNTSFNTDAINKTIDFVKLQLEHAEGGHDWWHIHRVWQLARYIAQQEPNVNQQTVELAALLHDIADSKFHNGDETIGPAIAKRFLTELGCNMELVNHVVYIIENISFKGGHSNPDKVSMEFYVVQDADRLDAIGAIGIARTFNYGGFKNRPLYDPNIAPNLNQTRTEYKNSNAPTLNHFYEKLLLLKDNMHTQTAKHLAENRHRFMEQYLEQFYGEWNGER